MDDGAKAGARPQGLAAVFPGMPEVRPVGSGDIRAALVAGWRDFRRAPAFGLFFGAAYALGGLVIVLSLTRWHVPWLIYPAAIGFPLIGPFIAVGLYEVSRRLERGERLDWPGVLGVVWAQRRRELGWMAFVMLFIFWVWMYQIRLLIALVLGRLSFSTLPKFVDIVLTTPEGWAFLVLGHIVGAVLALILFSVTVVSVPLLMERDLDIVTAMATSVRAVLASPVPMLGWGVVVTLMVLAGAASAFIGLLVVLPVLGHATWHLYRCIVPER